MRTAVSPSPIGPTALHLDLHVRPLHADRVARDAARPSGSPPAPEFALDRTREPGTQGEAILRCLDESVPAHRVSIAKKVAVRFRMSPPRAAPAPPAAAAGALRASRSSSVALARVDRRLAPSGAPRSHSGRARGRPVAATARVGAPRR